MDFMTKELSEIRILIDTIDNQVHDLLMERAALVSSVAAAKRKEGLQIVQPAREARMIRRLLRRHSGPLPEATIVRIWRELVGSVSLLQTGLSIAVAATDTGCVYWDMAKDYFGSAVPMKKIKGNPNTVGELREDQASFAVLPWPELDERSPWWLHLFEQLPGENISIICALPYMHERQSEHGMLKGVVISKIAFMPSDDDVSFMGLKLSTDVSRTKIVDIVKRAGLRLINVYSAQSNHDPHNYHLVEVKGYFSSESPELAKLKALFEAHCFYGDVLGGYPVIPELKKVRIG
jgi:chorismate mutase / prephenate dehydratase